VAISSCTVVGRFLTPTQTPVAGYLLFTPAASFGSGMTIVPPLPTRVDLGADGGFSVTVAVLDGAGSDYVIEWWLGAQPARVRAYQVRLTANTAPVDLYDMAPAVTQVAAPRVAPTARLVVGRTQLTASADASTSTAGSSPISTVAWQWGDGATTAAGVSLTAAHAYAAPGIYAVVATVTDMAGASNSATAQVTVSTVPAAPALVGAAGANSAALSWPTIGAGGSPLTGLLLERRPSGGAWAALATLLVTATSYNDTTPTYPTSFGYRLTATNANGSTASAEVTVAPTSPGGPLTARVTAVVSDLSVVADSSSSTGPNPIVSSAWQWGDGQSTAAGAAASSSHAYAAAGAYTVTVTVTDSTGVSSVASTSVTVAAATAMGTTYPPTFPASY